MYDIEELLERHKGLVYKQVNRFLDKFGNIYNLESHRDDLIQEGMIALWKAIERYDPSTGYQFSTFAVPYIYGTIYKYAFRKVPLIKPPRPDRLTKERLRQIMKKLDISYYEQGILLSNREIKTELTDFLKHDDIMFEFVEFKTDLLLTLDEDEYKLIDLIYFQGIAWKKAAKILNISTSTLYKRHAKVRKKILKLIA